MTFLDNDSFRAASGSVPLVAIDLVVCDASGRLLVGLRKNAPASGFWFAPGGRVRKGETLDQAFDRVIRAELGGAAVATRADASFGGVHEHFYDEDFTGAVGSGSHYVVLAYVISLDPAALDLPTDQHEDYRWVSPTKGLGDAEIHPYTKAYFSLVPGPGPGVL